MWNNPTSHMSMRAYPAKRFMIPLTSPTEVDRALEDPGLVALLRDGWQLSASTPLAQPDGADVLMVVLTPPVPDAGARRLLWMTAATSAAVGSLFTLMILTF